MKNLRVSGCLLLGMAIVLSVSRPAVVRSQEPRRLAQVDSVPVELVTALMAAGSVGSDPQILVGSIPEWFANRIYMPRTARVLGSAFQGTTIVSVISVLDEPDKVIDEFKRELPTRGWKPPPPMPTPVFSFSGGGFRPAPGTTPVPNPLGLTAAGNRVQMCGDQQTLFVTATRRRGSVTEVAIRSTAFPPQGYTACNPPPPPAARPSDSPFPTLYNPVDAGDGRSSNNCYDSNSLGSSGTGGMIRTAMDPVALLDHYARQLQDSGWQMTSKTAVVGRSWFRQEAGGIPVELTLTITVPRDTTCRQLSLQIRVPNKKP